MFNWIRKMVRNAVIEGVNEAAAELAGMRDSTSTHEPEITPLRLMTTIKEEEDTPRKRKVS